MSGRFLLPRFPVVAAVVLAGCGDLDDGYRGYGENEIASAFASDVDAATGKTELKAGY